MNSKGDPIITLFNPLTPIYLIKETKQSKVYYIQCPFLEITLLKKIKFDS